MSEDRNIAYAHKLSQIIAAETVSEEANNDRTKFYKFQELLRELFPSIFSVCEHEDFDGSMLLRWRGQGEGEPIMLMNHHDVVEATGDWKYPAFSGEIAEGKIWGRGTLDTKGGLFSMLEAADELAAQGFVPSRDVYFVSTCNEETSGEGGDAISKALADRGLRFHMVLDEGGMMLEEPIGGAKGIFAMVGVGEKGAADLKFVARSSGGHASTPPKNTPLVRLGKFMAEAERRNLFERELSPTVCEMFRTLSTSMSGTLKLVLSHPKLFSGVLTKVIPSVSSTAGAMLSTTLAFTMAQGSQGSNVLPQEAYVIGNMRVSHHEGAANSIAKISKLAKKYDIETVVLDGGFESPISSYESEAFSLVRRAVSANFEGVKTTPYIMTGASDCRYMSRVSDNCLRFSPFIISEAQLQSVHGIDENVDISTLDGAVDFYKYVITEA